MVSGALPQAGEPVYFASPKGDRFAGVAQW